MITRAFRLLPLGLALTFPALQAAGLPEALGGGRTQADLRLRYENVDQTGFDRDAEALTERLRLGYTTADWQGLDAGVAFEQLASLDGDRYNTGTNGHTAYPVIADPEGSEVDQAWLRYSGPAATQLQVGRQRLSYDNARFIGDAGWRQREQTFDALSLRSRPLPGLTLQYAYLDRVHGVCPLRIGDRVRDSLAIDGHALNLAWQPGPALQVVGYGYWLDFAAVPAPAVARTDSRTLGLRTTGSLSRAAYDYRYTLEYAHQSDFADAAPAASDYWLAEGEVARAGYRLRLAQERLGAGRTGFQTPLATLHAFQGWSDQFLVTPADGVRDTSLAIGGRYAPARLDALLRVHDYRADRGGTDYGRELEAQLTHALGAGLTLGLKAADYRADRYPLTAAGDPKDTRKLWAWIEYRFETAAR